MHGFARHKGCGVPADVVMIIMLRALRPCHPFPELECIPPVAEEPDKESIMEDYSLWQAVVALLVWWLVIGWPGAKILSRMGFSGWWILLAFVPIANIIGIWILATKPWPAERR